MSRLVSIAAALLPEPRRSIYREQWHADLRDADELGVSRTSILVGALLFGATHRWAPSTEALSAPERVNRGARRGLALLLSAGIVALGMYLSGSSVNSASGPVLEFLGFFVTVLQLAIVTYGVIAGILAIARVAHYDRTLLVATIAIPVGLVSGIVSVLVPAASFGLGVASAMLLIASGGAVGIRCLATVPVSSSSSVIRASASPRSRGAALIGCAAIVATVVVGSLDGLVWMPLALGPGRSLDVIYAAIRPDLWFSVGGIVAWALVGLALGVALLVVSRVLSSRVVVTVALLVVAAGIFASWFAAFGMGSAVSDAVPPYAGGASPVAPLYWFVGQIALVSVLKRTLSPGTVNTVEPIAA